MPYEIKVINKVKVSDLVAMCDDNIVKVRIGNDVYDVAEQGAENNSDGTTNILVGKCHEEWEWESDTYEPEMELRFDGDLEIEEVSVVWREPKNWHECLPVSVRNGNEPMTEDVVWEAIAEFTGKDVSEIADGDIIEYL